MKKSKRLAVVVASVGIVVSAVSRSAAEHIRQVETRRTVQEGVYTAEQAKRGLLVYQSECLTCHAENLTGGESGAPLVGDEFTRAWAGMTVGDLFERTRAGMPKDSPGRLSRQQYADVLAYILSANTFPAGETALPSDVTALQQIRWWAPK